MSHTVHCSTGHLIRHRQCDYMARLLLQYLALYNNKLLLNSIKILTNVYNFAKY